MFTTGRFAAVLLAALFFTNARAQVIDLSYDENESGSRAATFVLAGEPVPKVSGLFIADNTGYGEAVVGTSVAVGSLKVMPHVGVEWVRGNGQKGRALVLTSLSLGKFTFSNVN